MTNPVLYSYWRSSSAWRIRIALNTKGIEYDQKAVNLLKGEHKSDEYKAINPKGELPSLVIDGHTLSQSMSIIEYLEETRPDTTSLLPKDPYQRAKARQVAEIIASGIQPIQNMKVLGYVGAEKKAEWAKHWITDGFVALEETLKQLGSKDFCVGDSVTVADCFLVPQCYNARRWGVDMSAFPIISGLEESLSKLPAFVAADANNQPDAVVDAAK